MPFICAVKFASIEATIIFILLFSQTAKLSWHCASILFPLAQFGTIKSLCAIWPLLVTTKFDSSGNQVILVFRGMSRLTNLPETARVPLL